MTNWISLQPLYSDVAKPTLSAISYGLLSDTASVVRKLSLVFATNSDLNILWNPLWNSINFA